MTTTCRKQELDSIILIYTYIQGVPKKMFLSEMLRGRIFLNTPSFSMDKMRRI